MEPAATKLLADWEWGQADWERVAELYAGYLRAAWRRQIKLSLMASGFFLILGLVLKAMSVARPDAAPLPFGVVLLGFIPQFIIGANWLVDRMFIPRVRPGEEPRVKVGLEGLIIGNQAFRWRNFFNLIRADLVKGSNQTEPHTLMIRVSFGHGFATILVPVPPEQWKEAEGVASTLNREVGIEPRRAA